MDGKLKNAHAEVKLKKIYLCVGGWLLSLH